jgi:tetratricopeptide (TPR) repeat protein
MNNITDSYRLLGLRTGATTAEIKASYRRLAREYHPDFNPDNGQAKDKFIRVTEAYHYLINTIEINTNFISRYGLTDVFDYTQKPTETQEKMQNIPTISHYEYKLKWQIYEQLQQVLKIKKFPRAIALIEGLATRLPHDIEIRQWLAVIYYLWGQELIKLKQYDKARVYLKKALKTDGNNRSLCTAIQKYLHKVEHIFR